MRFFLLIAVLWCGVVLGGWAVAGDKWPGVDEAVVEKIAREQGRGARTPLINTDQGDLLLFVFLAAGAVGGFAAGYWWRMLIAEKRGERQGRVASRRGGS
ncbi:hypothetical protein GHYDROH2_20120 [Geobacter hydrogenophilus]|uniref:Cobalt ABC transporter permease n=1 Tax=Geobacter hydrogenophilus TaxID=40983 RepID=A0A9W6G0Y4_9BACT|nr:hypothetical protein GHYDROH2_20120 [Geobacter hydrogenophilus]